MEQYSGEILATVYNFFLMQIRVIRIITGLREQRLLYNFIQKTKNFATYITIYAFPNYICS